MPFIMLLFGAVLAITAYRGTTEELFDLLKGDFTGDKNFFYWIVSIGVVGLIGYIPRMEAVSRLIFVLIFVVVFVSNKGIFAKFTEALQSASATPEEPKQDAQHVQWSAGAASGSGSGSGGSTVANAFEILKFFA